MAGDSGGGGHLVLTCEFAVSCSGQGNGRGPMVSFSAIYVILVNCLVLFELTEKLALKVSCSTPISHPSMFI